jgi:hypothetical protein
MPHGQGSSLLFPNQGGLLFNLFQFKTEFLQSAPGFIKTISGVVDMFAYQPKVLLKIL